MPGFPPNSSPYPDIQLQPGSGLLFPWAEYLSKNTGSTADVSLSSEGASLGMAMIIYWSDLNQAVQALLGYSWRDTSTIPSLGVTTLRRILPWQHPRYSQLWCTKIASVKGVQFAGKEILVISDAILQLGSQISKYTYAILVLQFTRPKYPILTDGDTVDALSNPQEWLRYTDPPIFEANTNVLQREGGTFHFTQGGASVTGHSFTGNVGQRVQKLKRTIKWYQLPQAGIFNSEGLPTNLSAYAVANPYWIAESITFGPTYYPGAYSVGGVLSTQAIAGAGAGYQVGDVITLLNNSTGGISLQVVVTGVSQVTGGSVAGGYQQIRSFNVISNGQTPNEPSALVYTANDNGSPVSKNGNPSSGLLANFTVYWSNVTLVEMVGSVNMDLRGLEDYNPEGDGTFLGCLPGTLLLDAVEITPTPLQLPPNLMNLVGEIYQLQYDVTFHFTYFNPLVGPGVTVFGHNCYPFSGNGLWYPVASGQSGLPPFQSTDMRKLWQIL